MTKKEVVLFVVVNIVMFILGYICNNIITTNKSTSNRLPVDTTHYEKPKLDSLDNVEIKIKDKINYIDSINIINKYEANNLNDSDAVKLFYKLVAE